MNRQPKFGTVSAGHAETAAAGMAVLEAGGNAFDAAVAAVMASCIAEPGLTSLGGGGFLMAAPADAKPVLFDFFVQTPRLKKPGGRDGANVDFRSILVEFGGATQEFHIGLAAAGVPGIPAGLWRVHEALGRLPMTEVVQPALDLARKGHRISAFQAWVMRALEGLLLDRPEGRALFGMQGADGAWRLRPEGETLRFERMAELLDYCARHGVDEFYRGEVAQRIEADHRAGGGYLTAADLRAYRVEERRPLLRPYRGFDVWTNPAPSSGGSLIALQLALLEGSGTAFSPFGSRAWLQRQALVQDLVNRARRVAFDPVRHDPVQARALLSPEGLRPWLQQLHKEQSGMRATGGAMPSRRQDRWGSTTHISVLDAAGNAASVTTSVGQGCGYVIPGTDVMLNNMLGEADLNPDGFHQWTPDRRISSMMSPTVVTREGEVRLVLGTGGANRIRTAIAAVLHGVLDADALHSASSGGQMAAGLAEAWPSAEGDPEALLRAAIEAPRMHLSDGAEATLDLEGGFDPDAFEDLDAGKPWTLRPWTERNMYFGGVHGIIRSPKGAFGVADARRAGVVLAR